jgi:hypothetical protein
MYMYRRKNVGFSTISGFRHSLGVWNMVPVDKGDYCISNL